MRIWTLAAALGAMSMVGCTVREAPPPGQPSMVHHHHGEPAQKAMPKQEPPKEAIRRYRRPRQRMAGR